jgi:hypothetical protein
MPSLMTNTTQYQKACPLSVVIPAYDKIQALPVWSGVFGEYPGRIYDKQAQNRSLFVIREKGTVKTGSPAVLPPN